MVHHRFFVYGVLFLCICGCGDEIGVSRQVLEIVSPSDAVVTAPPESVWDGIRLSQKYQPREADFKATQRAFYTKYIDADGIAILSHTEVTDRDLIEARQVVLLMTAKFPALRDRLRVQRGGFYLILYAYAPPGSPLPDVPEFVDSKRFRNTCRMAYSWWIGGSVNGYCIAAVWPRYAGAMRIVTHELAHALDQEMEILSPGFWDQVKGAYRQAMELGTWRGEYAETSASEYWAVGAEMWFYDIGPGRRFETYEAFFERDPLLAELLSEWFPRIALPLR